MDLHEAVSNLIKVKGIYHTEIAYQKLVEAFDAQVKKEWVGLTHDELAEIYNQDLLVYNPLNFYRAIESKLKEKNALPGS